MANYDGEVVINTKIDEADYDATLSGYKVGAQELSNHIQQMSDKVKGLTQTQRAQMSSLVSKFNEQNNAYANQQQKIEELKNKWWTLYNSEKEILNVEKQIKATKDQLASGSLGVEQYMALQEKLEQLKTKYNELVAKKKEAFGSQTTERIGADVDKEQAKLDSMGNKLSETFGRINAKIQDYKNKSEGASKSTGALSGIMNRLSAGLGGLANKGLNVIANKFNSARNSAHNFGQKLKGQFIQILKYAVGLYTIRKAFNILRQSAKEGIIAMASVDAQTKASVDGIKNSVNGLKASLGSALAPLVNAIAPAVTEIVNMVTRAIHYVGMFISALTGKKMYKMATPINKTANAVNKNTKAINKNTKATNKNTKAKKKQNKELQRYLSGLDEMARWEEEHKDIATGNPNVTTPKTTGNTGGIGNNTTGLQVKVDEIKIPKSIRKLADTIKKYVQQGDWKGLGTFIGKKIESALDSIPWGNIQQTTGKVATNVAKFLNGIFGNQGLAQSVGRTVGEALNTILNIGYNFLKTFNFKKFGTFIGNALKSAIKTFDWVKLGKTFGKSLKAIKDTINGFWDGYDAGDFASGLAGAINTALDEYNDGEGMGKALGRTLQGVATEAVTFMADLDWSELGGDIGDTIWGFFKGFFNPNSKEAKNMFTKFQNFINGGKNGNIWEKLFGNNPKVDKSKINPLTGSMGQVLDEVGKLFGGVTVKADTKTKDLKKKVKKNMEDTAKESKNALKDVPTLTGNTFTDAWNTITYAFNNGKTKKQFDGVWGNIKSAFPSVKTWFSNTFTGAWKKIKNAFSSVKSFFVGIWNKIKNAFSGAVGWFKEKFSKVWEKIKAPFVAVGTWFKENVVDKIAGVFTGKNGIKAKIENAFSGIKGILKGVVNKIITGLNWMIDKAVALINGMASIYNSTIGKLPKMKTFKKIKAKDYHINYLAKGGVIPPNKEFLAVLGDQKHGTNIEAPADLIRQIVREESSASQYEFIAQINRKTLFDQVIDEAKLRKKQTGQNAFANI